MHFSKMVGTLKKFHVDAIALDLLENVGNQLKISAYITSFCMPSSSMHYPLITNTAKIEITIVAKIFQRNIMQYYQIRGSIFF